MTETVGFGFIFWIIEVYTFQIVEFEAQRDLRSFSLVVLKRVYIRIPGGLRNTDGQAPTPKVSDSVGAHQWPPRWLWGCSMNSWRTIEVAQSSFCILQMKLTLRGRWFFCSKLVTYPNLRCLFTPSWCFSVVYLFPSREIASKGISSESFRSIWIFLSCRKYLSPQIEVLKSRDPNCWQIFFACSYIFLRRTVYLFIKFSKWIFFP